MFEPYWLGRLEFYRLDRRRHESLLPADGDGELERLLSTISGELAERRGDSVLARNACSRPNEWLAPICYQIILAHLHHDRFEDLTDRILNFGRYSRNREVSLTYFQAGLMGMFAHERPSPSRKSDGQRNAPSSRPKAPAQLMNECDRERMSKKMLYAFRHYIPPCHLNGFNRQFPIRRGAQWRSYLEPRLYSWIVEERTREDLFHNKLAEFRGEYPEEIEEEVTSTSPKLETILRSRFGKSNSRRIADDDDDWD